MERLNRQGDDDHCVEAKSGTGKLDKGFWSTVSAFANTRGGIIVLGVSEDQQRGTFHISRILIIVARRIGSRTRSAHLEKIPASLRCRGRRLRPTSLKTSRSL
ncbi:AlbA family DNA-binding domain-containing protein [Corynebacterium sp. Marseille-Q4381]|uniref:AlbA family DNA-binding domain-containing protein n=1 Tax=Corynebacterium sp. Marseille-Q4381 TaxID=3121597 RepID=UPI003FA5B5DF